MTEAVGRRKKWAWPNHFFAVAMKPGLLETTDEIRITSSEMRFVKSTAKYTKSDHKSVITELKLEPMMSYIKCYQNSW